MGAPARRPQDVSSTGSGKVVSYQQ